MDVKDGRTEVVLSTAPTVYAPMSYTITSGADKLNHLHGIYFVELSQSNMFLSKNRK